MSGLFSVCAAESFWLSHKQRWLLTFSPRKLSSGLILGSSWENVWHKQLRKPEHTYVFVLCVCVCVCVCVYLPRFLTLQGLQQLDLFLILHIDPDDLISGTSFFYI